MYALIFSTKFVKMYIRFHVRCPLFLSDFNETSTFLANFLMIRQVRAELFRVDREEERQTDRQMDGRRDGHDKGNSRFTYVCERA